MSQDTIADAPMRQYLKRAAGILVGDVLIQVSPYLVRDGVVDGEGLLGDKPFDSIEALVKLAGWSADEAQAFLTRLNELINSRR